MCGRRLFAFVLGVILVFYFVKPVNGQSNLIINGVSDNRNTYSNNRIPLYNKLEITLKVNNTVAQNYQLPYDPSPPVGIDSINFSGESGISVDGLFLPPNQNDWSKAYRQPAFYYQAYDNNNGVKKISWANDGHNNLSYDWFYPTPANDTWMVRFAPNQIGAWQYKLTATDASGTYTESSSHAIDVESSDSHGFIKVSLADKRYFEFDDGTPFMPLAMEGNLDDQSLNTFSQNGVNLIRTWLSGLYGASWLQWIGERNTYDGYLPRAGLEAFPDSISGQNQLTVALRSKTSEDAGGWYDACRFDMDNGSRPVKQNTTYKVQIRYQASCIKGPANGSINPNYGLIGIIANPLDWPPDYCTQAFSPGDTRVITTYGHDTNGWTTISGTWNSGSLNFLPRIAWGLNNIVEDINCSGIRGTTGAKVWVDSVSLREVNGDGSLGPEILQDPSLRYDTYFRDQEAIRLDHEIEQAQKDGIYLKLVLQDKNDPIYYKINQDGTYVLSGDDNNVGFYGNWRYVNKTRWLEQAYWRYLQARWGYSTAIHSWEVTNEGDPFNGNHYAMTDELGKYMHCRVFGVNPGNGDTNPCPLNHPDVHMVTTSFWHSFPAQNFWASPLYPNIDYSDVHAYLSTGWLKNAIYETDSAAFHLDYSADTRSNLDNYSDQAGIATKPIIRGEMSMDTLNQQSINPKILQDTHGVWLHTLLWSSLDSGALTEEYWQLSNEIENGTGPDGLAGSGLWEIYKYMHNFTSNIPINTGHYVDAQATVSSNLMQSVGQKDTVNNRAHLWVRNKNFIWGNVVDGKNNYNGLLGTVTLSGFTKNISLPVEWHQFKEMGIPSITSSTVNSDTNGTITLNLPAQADLTDVGIKIGDYAAPTINPTPTPPPKPGDANGDGFVDGVDYVIWLNHFSQHIGGGASVGDFNNDGVVDGVDYVIWLNNYGK